MNSLQRLTLNTNSDYHTDGDGWDLKWPTNLLYRLEGAIGGEEAVDDHVPGRPLEGDVLPQHALAEEADLLQHPLRGPVLDVHQGLQPLQLRHLAEHRRRRRPHGLRRDAPPPVRRPQHVPDLPPAPVPAAGVVERDGDGADGAAVEADGPEPGVGQHRLSHVLEQLLLAGVGTPAAEAGHPLVGGPHHEVVHVRKLERPQGDRRRPRRRCGCERRDARFLFHRVGWDSGEGQILFMIWCGGSIREIALCLAHSDLRRP